VFGIGIALSHRTSNNPLFAGSFQNTSTGGASITSSPVTLPSGPPAVRLPTPRPGPSIVAAPQKKLSLPKAPSLPPAPSVVLSAPPDRPPTASVISVQRLPELPPPPPSPSVVSVPQPAPPKAPPVTSDGWTERPTDVEEPEIRVRNYTERPWLLVLTLGNTVKRWRIKDEYAEHLPMGDWKYELYAQGSIVPDSAGVLHTRRYRAYETYIYLRFDGARTQNKEVGE
jgi:hypothetical protein